MKKKGGGGGEVGPDGEAKDISIWIYRYST